MPERFKVSRAEESNNYNSFSDSREEANNYNSFSDTTEDHRIKEKLLPDNSISAGKYI